MDISIITRFCSEGNNLTDSGELASCFLSEFVLSKNENNSKFTLKAPSSWKHISGSPIMRDAFIY